jgi:hypothetical protein
LISLDAGHSIRLVRAEELESDNTVLRCETVPPLPSGESSVIVKRVTTATLNHPNSSGESQRFLNEWASLEFLSSLPGNRGYGPRLLGADRSQSFLVIEDLGRYPTVEVLLHGTDQEAARRALSGVGELLGEMQAATHGREAELEAAQFRLGTVSPGSDSTVDLRGHISVFEQCLDALGIRPDPGFWEALHRVEASIHDSELFRTFIHADAGPQNFLAVDRHFRLLDFEFGTFHHGLSDVVAARLGFPQTALAQSVPNQDAEILEQAYRRTVGVVMPEAADDETFNEALAAASAHWALNRWGGLWQAYFQEAMTGAAVVGPTESLDANKTLRSQAVTIYQSFITTARSKGLLLPIATTLASYVNALQRRWPDLDVMPVFPALSA